MVVTPTFKATSLPNCSDSFGWPLVALLPWQFKQLKLISIAGFAHMHVLKPLRLRILDALFSLLSQLGLKSFHQPRWASKAMTKFPQLHS
jgi:hypothetical protein